MNICLAQISSHAGDIPRNIDSHLRLIHRALAFEPSLIVFPELSITGYEPSLAKALATTPQDPRFNIFQSISDSHGVTVGIGVPTRAEKGVCISLVLFQPQRPRYTYSKQYLHDDERPYFIAGTQKPTLCINGRNLAFAICYELSVPSHVNEAMSHRAEIYLSSVAKTENGVQQAKKRLQEIARTNQVPALMVNSVGPADDFIAAGQSAVWDLQGECLAQLNPTDEGLLFFNSKTFATQVYVFSESIT